MEEKIPLYILWIIGFTAVVINQLWLYRLNRNFFAKAAINAAASSVLIIVVHAVANGELSNLFPFVFIVYGVPFLVASCLIQFLLLVLLKRK